MIYLHQRLYFIQKMLTPLNFPAYPIETRLHQGKNQLFDIIRRKWVVATPEEWVRQNMIHFLIQQIKVPTSLIAVEKTIQYEGLKKRFDILIYNSRFEPLVIVECKAPEVSVTNKVFLQISTYNIKLKAPFSIVTNGLAHYSFRIDFNSGSIQMLKDFPGFEEMSR